MKKILLFIVIFTILAAVIFSSVGKIAPLSWQLWGDVNQENGIAIKGYDVVSYHVDGKPIIGNKEISSNWNGVEWHFTRAENKVRFDLNPERYVPTYGGFCAFAILKNFTADVDPKVWHIEKERLYLFASESPRKGWVAEISKGAINESDLNWSNR